MLAQNPLPEQRSFEIIASRPSDSPTPEGINLGNSCMGRVETAACRLSMKLEVLDLGDVELERRLDDVDTASMKSEELHPGHPNPYIYGPSFVGLPQ